jgi:predicted DNA-binding protein (MmcQ/YjbR family)
MIIPTTLQAVFPKWVTEHFPFDEDTLKCLKLVENVLSHFVKRMGIRLSITNLKCDPSFELRGEYAINPGFHMSKIHSGACSIF